ncbi:MAG: hypothetical protein OCD02_06540 [Spirochaetaceae bacterium]
MIIRKVYRAQLHKDKVDAGLKAIEQSINYLKKQIENEQLMTISLYNWEYNLFLYYESVSHDLQPEKLFTGLEENLIDWPGKEDKRYWIPMIDVFHFNEPVSKEHWQRKTSVERKVGKVAHLKPQMVSSYIYYHYQVQEERAFPGDKYEIISMHENLLFGYFEFPKVMEEPLAEKKLQTTGTPDNWADAHMDQHFLSWEDGTIFFKEIETLFTL